MSKDFKWEPWETYSNSVPVFVDIKEPPCKLCKYFCPRVITNHNGDFDGVVICIAEEMYKDFSCFRLAGVVEEAVDV